MDKFLRPAWVEIDLDAVRHNAHKLKEFVGPSVHLIAVLKADALGHGMIPLSRCLIRNGVEMVGVGDLGEALRIRAEVSKSIPILLLPSLPVGDSVDVILKNGVLPSLSNMTEAKAFAEKNPRENPAPVFVKVDTGYLRAGVKWSECVPLCEWVVRSGRLSLQGLYTHMAAPEDQIFTREQFDRFQAVVRTLEDRGIEVPWRCVASTAVVLQYPEMHLNCVDCGRLFYGIRYLPDSLIDLGLCRIFKAFKTKIIQIRSAENGETVGYGRTYRMKRAGTLGLIPVGWSHGYPSTLANRGDALVKGRRVKVIGSVATEHMILDVTDLEGEILVGEEVVLIGNQGNEKITLEEVSSLSGVSMIQLTTAIGNSVSRIYVGG
jgi:alanine racemase